MRAFLLSFEVDEEEGGGRKGRSLLGRSRVFGVVVRLGERRESWTRECCESIIPRHHKSSFASTEDGPGL